MTSRLRVLAIIPARGGSKGLPGKNIRPLAGKPLIAWSIEAARGSEHVDEIVVSTDSQEIASTAAEDGARVLMRPPELATDDAMVADAIEYHLNALAETGEQFDAVALLQPTSPLRPSGLLDDCIEQMLTAEADSIATFSPLDVPLERLWVIRNGSPELLIEDVNPWLPRQALNQVYHLNGLLYIFRVPAFLARQGATVLVGKTIAKMTPELVDIDTIEDFTRAEQLLSSGEWGYV